jgi:hypothetical protein
MTDLSHKLLAAARDGLAPDEAVAERVRARVAAAIGAASATCAVTTTGTATAATPAGPAATAVIGGGAGSFAAQLATVLLVVGVIATTIAVVVSRTSLESSRSSDVPSLAITTIDVDEPAHAVQVVAVEPALPAAPRTPTAERTSRTATAHARADAGDQQAAQPSLSREVELIDLAMLALRRGAPSAALATLGSYDTETRGRGQMAEEAAAIDIEARCRLGEDVGDRVEAFDRRWPSSAQRARLHAACFTR